MKNVNTLTMPWPISDELVAILHDIVKKKIGACLVNFRAPNNSPERGGLHPVDIMIGEKGEILYITDFLYSCKPPYKALVKEIDFDFTTGIFQHMSREYPLKEGRTLYRTWEMNFVAYHRMGSFQFTVEEF